MRAQLLDVNDNASRFCDTFVIAALEIQKWQVTACLNFQ